MNPECVVKSWPRTFASCCSLIAALIGVAACGAAASDSPRSREAADPTLFATGAWARAADSAGSTAVYFVLENRATVADTVRGASSEIAESAGLHVSTQHSGMMHMTSVPALPLPANDSVSFRPLGAHVMLLGLRRALFADDTVVVLLSFGSGRTLEVRAGVRAP
jgi:periplasmic copper chaperone A